MEVGLVGSMMEIVNTESHGGMLPGAKVTPEIATIRGIPIGRDSRSPNRHPDIADAAALLDFVARVRVITGKPTECSLRNLGN